MQMSRWLRIMTLLVGLNAVAVAWSVVQRHVLASAQDQVPSTENDPSETKPDLVDAFTEGKSAPAHPSLETLEVPAANVPDDDPLLNEIRKHAATQFPELSLSSEQTDRHPVVSPEPKSSHYRNDLELVHHRLQVVSHLNSAAALLVKTAVHQSQLGQQSQADLTLERVQQLKMLMVELLSQ